MVGLGVYLHRGTFSCLFAAACIIGSVGCGESTNLVPVKGSVKAGGKPAAGANVLFHPEDPANRITASGVADSNGEFSIMSGLEQGILPGTYKVTVTWPDPAVKPTQTQIMMGTAEDGPDLLQGKYAARTSTPLTATVSGGQTEPISIDVDAP
jgi:hypothetical protein